MIKVTKDFGMDPDTDLFVRGTGRRIVSEDPDTHPDPYQNETDPEHWLLRLGTLKLKYFC